MKHEIETSRTVVRTLALALAAPVWMGCATIGPMPGMTGQNAATTPRPGAEAQVAAVPGHFLSDSVDDEGTGSPMGQASGMIEPGDAIGVPGLGIGGRYVDGRDGPGIIEPMVRYRFSPADRLGIAGVAYGTGSSGSADGASYSMVRGGAEAIVDVRATPSSHWAELHFEGGVGATGLSAEGDYCTGQEGYAVGCDDNPADTHAEASGVYPSFHVGASGHFARHLESAFHGIRLSIWLAGGWMPHLKVENPDPNATRQVAETQTRRQWSSAGLGLAVDLGSNANDGQMR